MKNLKTTILEKLKINKNLKGISKIEVTANDTVTNPYWLTHKLVTLNLPFDIVFTSSHDKSKDPETHTVFDINIVYGSKEDEYELLDDKDNVILKVSQDDMGTWFLEKKPISLLNMTDVSVVHPEEVIKK